MFNIVNLFALEGSQIIIWVVLAVLVVFMFVLPMITNRKRNKEVNEMFDSLSVGDEVMTIGGVMGKVIELSTHESGEKLMTIETGEGSSKTTMTFTVQALRLNYTKTKLRQEQLAREKAAKEAAKHGASESKEKNEESSLEEASAELPAEAEKSDEQQTAEQPEERSEEKLQEEPAEKND